jgi:hypothetical protein
MICQSVRVGAPGEFGLGGVQVAEHQQRAGQVCDRPGQQIPGTGAAQVPGSGARCLRCGGRVGDAERARQVQQRTSQVGAVPIPTPFRPSRRRRRWRAGARPG